MADISIEKFAHSADKDHTAMAGGTFGLDKIVRADGQLRLYQYLLPLIPISGDRQLFSGIHSVEHALAFSPETGSLRFSVTEVTGEHTHGDQVIDISPYVADIRGKSPVMGFRATYVSAGRGLSQNIVGESFRRSLQRMQVYYAGGGAAPFSTPKQCGQYNTHSTRAALDLIALGLQLAGQGNVLGGKPLHTEARELYVCDLRLVRPREEGNLQQRVLDPLAGHLISQLIEQDAATLIPGGSQHTLKTGNFGCSTGEYVMLANPQGADRQSWLRISHTAITRVLLGIASAQGSGTLEKQAALDAAFCLEHFQRANPSIYRDALRRGQMKWRGQLIIA
jgi:S-ribosylhomocysteine lyase LuxS involved in autoinducer biosynthesis